MKAKGRGGGWALAFLAILLASRSVILTHQPPGSDAVTTYRVMAGEDRSAALEGLSIYEWRARRFDDAMKQATPGRPGDRLEERARIEYPPLAVLWIRLPPAWQRAVGFMSRALEDEHVEYVHAYRAGMAGLEMVLVAALVILAWRLFPDERGSARFERLMMYVTSTLALWPVLYDRLDLGQAMLVQGGLCLLVSRLHYACSFLLLAAAIHFKLMPIVLAPVFLLGSMPAKTELRPSGRTLRLLIHRVLVLAAITIGGFLAFYAVYGVSCLGFLAYHRDRGIQIESLHSSVLLGLHETGYPVNTYYAHGSFNLGSSLSSALAALAPRLMAASSLAVAALCWGHFRRFAERDRATAPPQVTFAQLYPQETVSYALLGLLVITVTNKVLSPQYLLWLAPLVPLISRRMRGWLLYQWSFFVCCALTTALYPYLLHSDVVRTLANGQFATPTHRAIVILLSRNLLLLGLTVSLAWHLWKSGDSCQEGRPDAAPEPSVSAATTPAG